MSRNRGKDRKDTVSALIEARRARRAAEEREAALRSALAQELGLMLLDADGGAADPAALHALASTINRLGVATAIARLGAGTQR